MAGVSITVKNPENLPKLEKTVTELIGTKFEIGVIGKKAKKPPEGAGIGMVKLATIQEFGKKIKVTDKMRRYLAATGLHLKKSTKYIKIPARRFMRNGYKLARPEIIKLSNAFLPMVLKQAMSIEEYFGVLGEKARSVIVENAKTSLPPANHPYTIKRKGSATTLTDTGAMIQSITWQVTKK